MISRLPVLGICGYSGSGKTTLILELVSRLQERGIDVAVIKHNVPGLEVDREGKDSDRFFKAGADVVMRGKDQSFVRMHSGGEVPLDDILAELGPRYDMVILEGHKAEVEVEKIWVKQDPSEPDPGEAVDVVKVLDPDEDRVGIVMEFIESWLREKLAAAPLYGGVLIGGESRRMGEPKHLIRMADGRTWLENAVSLLEGFVGEAVILGKGEVPEALSALKVLPDVEGKAGPVAGMVSAMRWAPFASWLFMACDQPMVSAGALRWLLGHRKPGVWSVVPRGVDGKRFNPFPGYYDFRVYDLLNGGDRPSAAVGSGKALTPEIPDEFISEWRNINTPRDLQGAD